MDLTKLSGIIPDLVLQQLTPQFLQQSQIDGPNRLSHFLGQTKEETGDYTAVVENLNYSAEELWELFPTHFDNQAQTNDYAHQPEKIANRIYANRMGNGDESSGEGYKYRGRGYLQLTGKNAYLQFSEWLSPGSDYFIQNPEVLDQPQYALLSAAWFFNADHLWPICDKGVDLATITIITKHVNGGTINLTTRVDYTQSIHKALTGV